MPVDFDTQAFRFPFYRVTRFDEVQLAADLAALGDVRPMAADAKAPAGNVAMTHGLMRLGFRKVCMQITLRHDLAAPDEIPASEVRIAGRLGLGEEIVRAHARNFTKDRFSLDPLLPGEGRYRLYHQWLRNSLGGAKQVAHIGPNLCTFSRRGDDVVIDLISILEQRRGYGARIIGAVVEYARHTGAASVRVTTECENAAAWSLYLRKGFVPEAYTSAFHLVLI